MSELILPCPECDEHDVPKLYINVDKGLFNCFRCGFSGKLSKLKRYPSILDQIQDKAVLAAHLKRASFVSPVEKSADVDLDLSTLSSVVPGSAEYAYLLGRGWTSEMFLSYSPMVSSDFSLEDRVIIPIYDAADTLIYYVARHIYGDVGPKYKNAMKSKDSVLFFSQLECNLFYRSSAVVCEGIFDAAKIPNAVALLGKTVSRGQEDALFKFLRNKKDIYLCLDKDTEADSKVLDSKLCSWFPQAAIYRLEHSAFAEKDLGDMAKKLSSHELFKFIVAHSTKSAERGLSALLRNRLAVI